MPDPTTPSLPPVAEFGTVVRDPLPEQIANRLVALISERQLRPGDRLPPERELAVTMGVSRASLREALRALSLIGVTEMRQGAGNYVASLDPATLMASSVPLFSNPWTAPRCMQKASPGPILSVRPSNVQVVKP